MVKADILFVIDDMIVGGAQRSLLSLLSCLDYTRASVDLLILNKTGGFLGAIPGEVRILDTVSHHGNFFKKPVTAVWQLIKAGRPDLALKRILLVLMSRWNRDVSGYYQVSGLVHPVGMRKEYSAVISCHYLSSLHFALHAVPAVKKFHWYHHGDVKQPKGLGDFIAQSFRLVDGVFAVTAEHRAALAEAFPEVMHKISILPNAVSADVIRKRAQEACLLDQVCDAFKIVSLGRLSPEKGNDLAICACRGLVDAGYAVKWFIVGDGPERFRLERMIEEFGVRDQVVLVGETSNPYPYLRAADLVVQPSLVESFGYAIAEAKVLGKAVLATDTPGARAQLINGVTGVVTASDPAALTAAVAKLINNPELRVNIGRMAVTTMPSSADVSDRFFELIEQ